MPTAKCQDCGKLADYRNRRGARIADYRCACGGKFKACRGDGSPIVRPPAGPLIPCAFCGKKRREGGNNLKTLSAPRTFKYRTGSLNTAKEHEVRLETGSKVCWYHDEHYSEWREG